VVLYQEGRLQEAIPLHEKAIEQFEAIGDVKHASRAWKSLGVSLLQLGQIEKASESFEQALKTAAVFDNKADYAIGYWYRAQTQLCQGHWEAARQSFEKAGVMVEDIPQLRKEWVLSGLGRVYLAQGIKEKALNPFRLALQDGPFIFLRNPYQANEILSGLEQAHEDGEAFRAFSEQFRQQHPDLYRSPFVQWHLTPAEIASPDQPLQWRDTFREASTPGWEWVDPIGDCAYSIANGLTILAANERNLHHVNRSAPRLLRQAAVLGDFTIQVACQPARGDRPAIGGLLVWLSEKYWFCLESGGRGAGEITLRGFMENHDLVFGRGQLLARRKVLRLERRGNRLSAFCCRNEKEWFYAGSAELSTREPLKLGIHAIGHINRIVYPGAYPHGTAIRFKDFGLWAG
jgi:hypothetical protein